ncbi:MAG: DinB family protein [Gemmatimonadota bacterium]
MLASRTFALVAIAATLAVAPTVAQGVPTEIRDEMLGQFANSSAKMTALSEAVPADLYGWAPSEGLMTVATVYAHIARYNFMYLSDNLGIPAPDGVDWENLESLTDKMQIVDALKRSIEHVKEQVEKMTEADLTAMTQLYGREVPGWAVLTQLVAHMNEHVGQSVAYARMNGVVPPWSR